MLTEKRRQEISYAAHKLLMSHSSWGFPNCEENFETIDKKIIVDTYGVLHPNYEAIRDFEGRITAPSETGYSLYNATNGMYIVVYNERQYFKRRIWTLAHEFGHIALKHHILAGVTYSTELYKAFEAEANFFASELLAPTPLLSFIESECGRINESDLGFVFRLSGEAASYRLRDYRMDKRYNHYRQHYGAELQLVYGQRVLPDRLFNEMYVLPFEKAVSM